MISMKYFAYGSNMDGRRMKRRMQKIDLPFSEREHAGLRGYGLKFNKVTTNNPREGKANIEPNSNGAVEGVLYDVLDLSKFDEFEPGYYRDYLTVELDDGTKVSAATYVADPDKVREGLKPTKEYMSHLLAARSILSESYVKKLESFETLD